MSQHTRETHSLIYFTMLDKVLQRFSIHKLMDLNRFENIVSIECESIASYKKYCFVDFVDWTRMETLYTHITCSNMSGKR